MCTSRYCPHGQQQPLWYRIIAGCAVTFLLGAIVYVLFFQPS